MKRITVVFSFLLLLVNCEENNYYDTDPRLFNDAMHGNIVGKVMQKSSKAIVIISQVNPVDSAEINSADGSFEIKNLPIGNYDVSIKADNFRIYKLCNVMVQGAGNTYIGEIDLSTVPDLVSSHYPEDLAEIVYNNRYSRLTVSIIFTQPMDRESVEKAFSTIPATEGIFHWGQYSEAPSRIYYSDKAENWGYEENATITTFSKITAFSYQMAQKDCFTDTSYKVILSTEASDTAGNQLRFPLEFSFSTVQSSSTQNGIITYPSHGDIDVDLISNNGIRMTFPRNMDRISTEAATHVSPVSDRMCLWPQKNQLTIYTGGVFHANTEYTVTIDSTAEDMDGIKLGNSFSFSFKTAPVSISSTSPRNGELFVSNSSAIYLYFNTYMQKSTVQSAFSINPGIPGTLDWNYDSKTTMKFTPSQSFQYNTEYTVTIDTHAKDIFETPLKETYTFSFIVRPE
ncbi:MAG: Ig-like domain-containing protein [Bacteroidales bacterium]|nr:Ig-like domain-containing protein [Bacteroidales bacterium]